MSKFLKLKKLNSASRILINAEKVEYVSELHEGTLLSLDSGEEVTVKESYQTVVNRLTKGDEPAGE